MKLADLLARELESWPIQCEFATQDPDMEVRFDRPDYDFFVNELAEDAGDNFGEGNQVSRYEWQSARDKLKGETKVPKANKDGWIRHRGGKCPVAEGIRVDYRMRNDKLGINERAELLDWGRDYECPKSDIMAYRIHAPEQASVNITMLDTGAAWQMLDNPAEPNDALKAILELDAPMPAAKYFDGPLQWRDRIHTIDFDKAAAQQAHDAAMAALDSERAELVSKLKSEGLALISEPIKEEDSAEVDMGDWRNWARGDIVECIKHCDGQFTEGGLYEIRVCNDEYNHVGIVRDDRGDDTNGWLASNFKWHSRPSKP